MHKKACKKRDLESLLGLLQHVTTVIRPGCTFVRRLIRAAVHRQKIWPLDPPQLNGPFGSKVVAAVYGGVEWCVPHAMSVQARYCTRIRCLRLLGVWGTLGDQVVSVALLYSSGRVVDCPKRAAAYLVGSGGVGP